jgi:DNA-binding MarR family transcriptional regulator
MTDLPFGFDEPEDSPGFLLWQTTMIWQRQIRKALEVYDVSHAQFVIMASLIWLGAHEYDTTQTSIIHETKLDKMTVSNSLKRLVSLGYVTRVEHEIDTRAKSVTLTQQGKNIIKTLVPIVEGVDKRFFKKAGVAEQKELIKILNELIS